MPEKKSDDRDKESNRGFFAKGEDTLGKVGEKTLGYIAGKVNQASGVKVKGFVELATNYTNNKTLLASAQHVTITRRQFNKEWKDLLEHYEKMKR